MAMCRKKKIVRDTSAAFDRKRKALPGGYQPGGRNLAAPG